MPHTLDYKNPPAYGAYKKRAENRFSGQNARREFVRYFVLRASSNFATGCHDE